MQEHSVARLIGAPPGYIGYEEGGQLTEAVRRRPYSLILLDEIEKAHSEIFNILLQVLDDGRLTDGQGRTVNFRNTIIIMTSNLGSHIIQNISDKDDEAMESKIQELLRNHFRPEFLNRIDDIVLFHKISQENMKAIVDIQIKQLQKSILENKNIELDISDVIKSFLATNGYDPAFGARPLRRLIQSKVLDPLANQIIAGKVKEQQKVKVDLNKNGVITFYDK
jgi:ATP-dependent Clp protease ATP-binding subunit ClpB